MLSVPCRSVHCKGRHKMFLVLLLTVASCSQLSVAFTCEETTPELCACQKDGWTLIGSTCYLISEDKLTWAEANAACEAENANLAEIYDETEEAVLLEEARARSSSYFWIGLTDSDTDGTFTWNSGATAEYTDWMPNQPDNSNNVEYCVHLYFWPHANGWNDYNCANTSGYICEAKGSYVVDVLQQRINELEEECTVPGFRLN